MRNWAFRLSIASILVALTVLGTFGRAHASLGFCRTDPVVTFITADGSKTTVVLSAGISLPSASVTIVEWTIQLPAGSTLDKVSPRGGVPETIAITANGAAGTFTAGADVISAETAGVTVDAQVGRNPHNTAISASGSTNTTVTVSISV